MELKEAKPQVARAGSFVRRSSTQPPLKLAREYLMEIFTVFLASLLDSPLIQFHYDIQFNRHSRALRHINFLLILIFQLHVCSSCCSLRCSACSLPTESLSEWKKIDTRKAWQNYSLQVFHDPWKHFFRFCSDLEFSAEASHSLHASCRRKLIFNHYHRVCLRDVVCFP